MAKKNNIMIKEYTLPQSADELVFIKYYFEKDKKIITENITSKDITLVNVVKQFPEALVFKIQTKNGNIIAINHLTSDLDGEEFSSIYIKPEDLRLVDMKKDELKDFIKNCISTHNRRKDIMEKYVIPVFKYYFGDYKNITENKRESLQKKSYDYVREKFDELIGSFITENNISFSVLVNMSNDKGEFVFSDYYPVRLNETDPDKLSLLENKLQEILNELINKNVEEAV